MEKAIAEPAAIELIIGTDNQVRLRARQPGRYEVTRASARQHWTLVLDQPRSLVFSGPWEVEFQQGECAPERIQFNALTDWSQHTNPTVKYFSGTACYRKRVTVANDLFGKGQQLELDLGDVAVMAQVRLNGKDLGILWKPPYRVDVTRELRSGENQLEIKVVNLWVNRMIGDEQLREDSERNPDGTLKKWPQWLQEGLSSPAGRFSFTTWRLWKRDSPLQRSGLLGPVRIMVAQEDVIPSP
jgi:hypothetical protein